MPQLQVYIVYVDEYERVGTVLELTRFSIVSILTRASACCTPSVAVTVLPAIVQRQQIDVLVVRNYASICRKRRVFHVVEALMASARPHILPPSRPYVLYTEHREILIEPLL